MRMRNFLILLVVAVIASIFASYEFYTSFVVEDAIAVPMEVKIDDHFGLNADSSAIKFGRILPSTSAERGLTINNTYGEELRITIINGGEMAGWVRMSENNFILLPGEAKNVTYTVTAPKTASHGDYTGKSTILFRKVLFG